jgi:CubicO group peptidase (beta-lactamase class C family)
MQRALIAVVILGAMVRAFAAEPYASLDSVLEPIRAKANLPALAAAVVRSNQIVAAGAVGVRKFGATNRVTIDDKFHIGSCTKSMTATLAAMLVEQNKFSWDTTIGSEFPDWEVNPEYKPVTVAQLFSHIGGVPGDLARIGVWDHVWQRASKLPTEQRIALAKELLAREPAAKPDSKMTYANAGYTIAGVIMERREKRAWEDLLRERLFVPLGMSSAGFGMPGDAAKLDQPWGHSLKDGKFIAMPPGFSADNPAAIGPGGTVHCSILDFARYAQFHLQGERGDTPILRGTSFTKLHTPAPGHDYAMGWFVTQRAWGKGRVLTHNGTNTRNFAVMWLAPNVDFAVVVVTNLGGDGANKACDTAAWTLIQQFLVSKK